ncbi:MAG: putative RNA-binding protein (virulence factor B family), partial [Bacteroidia bacterium]
PDANEVLLPQKYITEEMEIGGNVDVFILHDSESRLVATTETPLAFAGDFAVLEVKHVIEGGAFLDIGLDKDLFAPINDQYKPMEVGKKYVVRVMVHPKSEKLVGIGRIGGYLEKAYLEDFFENDEVEAFVYDINDVGYQCLINEQYSGIIYENEVFKKLEMGEKVRAYVKNVREDGRIELFYRFMGYDGIVGEEKEIIEKLKNAKGNFLPFHDKSDPMLIKREFNMSKKTFKKLVGLLYRKRLIKIEDGNGISLIRKEKV